MVTKSLIKHDVAAIEKVGARFTSHVFPGETLSLSLWHSDSSVYFETSVIERAVTVVKGFMTFKKHFRRLA